MIESRVQIGGNLVGSWAANNLSWCTVLHGVGMEVNKSMLWLMQIFNPYSPWSTSDVRDRVSMYGSEERLKARFHAGLSPNNGRAICLLSLPQEQELLTALPQFCSWGQKTHELFNIPVCLSERTPTPLGWRLLDKSNYSYHVTTHYMFQYMSPDDS
jgi:hypothetical protein